MSILVDTNLLLRSMQPDSPQFQAATESLRILQFKETLCVVPQILYELWVVSTRPAGENGIGMTTIAAKTELLKARALFQLLPNPSSESQDRGRSKTAPDHVSHHGSSTSARCQNGQ
jgi:hypothetical protein